MPVFECRYVLGGALKVDYISARTEEEAWDLVERRGGEVESVTRLREVGTPPRHPVNDRNLSLAFTQMASLLSAGLPLPEVLRIVSSQFAPPLGEVFEELQAEVSSGIALGDAMERKGKFPPRGGGGEVG